MERSESIGTYGELVFASECVNRGYKVFNPVGNNGYDCLVECNGKYTRVQVKSTRAIESGNRYAFNINTKSKEADVYVFHVIGAGLFFIISSEEVRKRKSTMSISKKSYKHLNNWAIFE